jgi:hypothetical protein
MSGAPAVVGVARPEVAPVSRADRRREPDRGPFQHQDVADRRGNLRPCDTQDAQPGWVELEANRWSRTCGCRTEIAYTSDGRFDPSSEAARPSWRAHRHGAGCEHADVAALVKVEHHPDGGWKSSCVSCGTLCGYWWDDEVWQRQADGSMAKVTARGPVRFVYPLAADDV